MTRVLFVDDEPALLRAIERAMRVRKVPWTMAFATSGQDALVLLEQETFDVIVSDVGMPGLDGVTLLEKVRAKHPEVARIALSGEAREEHRMRAVVAIHQWIPKPCPMARLAATIERVQWARTLADDPEIRALACGIASLPLPPAVHVAIARALERHEDVGELIETDAAITAKLLQIVNSSFFAHGERIASVHRAVAVLGQSKLRELLKAEMFHASPDAAEPARSGLRVAKLSRALASAHHEEAFLAGLLHDVATLVLGSARAMTATPRVKARVSAMLLATWGLPDEVVNAVAFHRDPESAPDPSDPRLCALALACALADPSTPDELVGCRAHALGLDAGAARELTRSFE